jgi:hypothetical protein
MANTFSSSLNAEAIVNGALEAFTLGMAPLTAFSTDFDSAGAAKKDRVQVPFVPAASAAADFAGTYTRQDSTVSAKEVVLNKHKFVSWYFTDTDATKSPVITSELFGRQKGYQLLKAVFQDILSVVTNANYGAAAVTSSAVNFDAADIVDVKEVCDQAGMPENPRSLILTSTYWNQLLKENVVSMIEHAGAPARTGEPRQLFGFRPYSSNVIPANSENLVGFAAYPSAILLAMRYLQPVTGDSPSGLNARAVTDPETRITLGYRQWYDYDKGTQVNVLECFYGFAVGEAAALKRIVSA